MFSDLYDAASRIFWWRWPKADGAITAVNLRLDDEAELVVLYEFSVGSDGPYSGESSWAPGAFHTDVTSVSDKLRVGQSVTVRYRRDDPSINTLDRPLWRDWDNL
jgi:hypothetical protein